MLYKYGDYLMCRHIYYIVRFSCKVYNLYGVHICIFRMDSNVPTRISNERQQKGTTKKQCSTE